MVDLFIYSSTIHHLPNNETEIILWGLTEKSVPTALRVVDYNPHVYIKLPQGNDLKTYNYSDRYLDKLQKEFKNYYPAGIVDVKFEYRTNFYYYIEKCLYAKIYLRSVKEEELFNRYADKHPFKIHGKEYKMESVYDKTIVGDDTKFFSSARIRKTGWISFDGDQVDDENRVTIKSRRNNLEYTCFIDCIRQLERIDIPVPITASIDIEVQSSDGNFPKSSNVKDVVYLISIVTEVNGKSHKIALCSKEFDRNPDVNTIYEPDNTKLLEKFFETILKLDPDCIIGYNIIGFDFPYMMDQLSINNVDIPRAGRVKDSKVVVLKESWSSSASKVNKYSFPIMEGRVVLDLFPIVRRNMMFIRYNLNTVAKILLNEEKHDIEYKEMYRIYKEGTTKEMAQVVLYCVQDSILVLKMFKQLQIWYWVIEKSANNYYEMNTIMYIGQQRQFISLLYVVAEEFDFILNRRHSVNYMKYEGGFVGEITPDFYENVMVLDFNSLYPSIINAYNICPSTLLPPQSDVPDTTNVDVDISNVVDPETKPRKISGNMRRNESDSDSEHSSEDEGENRRITTYKFVKKEQREGLLPKLVVRLLKARKDVKDMMAKYPEDSLEYMILDKKQNSIKISNNTIYGIMGAQEGGKFSCVECSTSITAIGRDLIKRINTLIETKYGGVIIYNDTDSTMFTIPNLPRNQLNSMGKEIAKNVISFDTTIPQGMKIGFEKSMDMLITSKKKYVGRIIADDGGYVRHNGEIVVLKRGVASVRRDTSELVKNIYDELCNMIFDKVPFHECYSRIVRYIKDLYERKFDISNFIIVKQLRSGYENESTPILVYSRYLESIGRKVSQGDRLEYIVCVSSELRVGERMRPIDMVIDGKEHIDYDYYVKQAQTSIFRITTAGYKEKADRYIDIHDLSETRKKTRESYPVLDIINWFLKHKKYIIEKEEGTLVDVFENLDRRYDRYLEKYNGK